MRNLATLLLLTLLPFSTHALEGQFSVGCGKGEVENIYDTTRCDASVDLKLNTSISLGVALEHRDVERDQGDPSDLYLCGKYNFRSGTTLKACGSENRYLVGLMHRGEPVYNHGLFLDGLYYLGGMDHGKTWSGGSSRTRTIFGAGWVMSPQARIELHVNTGDQNQRKVRDVAMIHFIKNF